MRCKKSSKELEVHILCLRRVSCHTSMESLFQRPRMEDWFSSLTIWVTLWSEQLICHAMSPIFANQVKMKSILSVKNLNHILARIMTSKIICSQHGLVSDHSVRRQILASMDLTKSKKNFTTHFPWWVKTSWNGWPKNYRERRQVPPQNLRETTWSRLKRNQAL